MMICGSDEAVSMLIRMCKRSRSNRALLVKKKLNDQMQLPEKKVLSPNTSKEKQILRPCWKNKITPSSFVACSLSRLS